MLVLVGPASIGMVHLIGRAPAARSLTYGTINNGWLDEGVSVRLTDSAPPSLQAPPTCTRLFSVPEPLSNRFRCEPSEDDDDDDVKPAESADWFLSHGGLWSPAFRRTRGNLLRLDQISRVQDATSCSEIHQLEQRVLRYLS